MRLPTHRAARRDDVSPPVIRAALLLTAAVAFVSPPAFGQRAHSAASNERSMTSVFGVVGDSLHGGPLAGAIIMVDGQIREGVTDSIGRFRIDSVAAGEYRVGVFHPILDSLGTSLATRPVQFTPGKPLLISLATPSGRTIRHALCPNLPRHVPQYEHGDSGIAVLVGRVLDPDYYTAVPGAVVTLSWIQTTFRGIAVRITPYERETTTDTAGEFRFCAVPTGLNGHLRATAGPDDAFSVQRDLSLEGRIVTMTTVHLYVPASAPRAATHAVLTGEVQRPDGSPLPGATAIVEGTRDSAVSDSNGTFTMRGLPTGTHMLVVRSVGFEPVSDAVELTNREAQHVNVALLTPARELDAVIVRAERLAAGYARVGFDRRRRSGIGTFLTADDIATKHAGSFSDLLAGLGGLQLSAREGVDGVTGGDGVRSCVAYLLDGQPIGQAAPSDLDALLQPDEIGAIEVYSAASVPEELRVRSTGAGLASVQGRARPGETRTAAAVEPEHTEACTTIVVWTKTHLGVRDELTF